MTSPYALYLISLLLVLATSEPLQAGSPKCGGYFNETRGVIHTPNFPQKFSIPIECRWVIDASHLPDVRNISIVLYFTQLYVTPLTLISYTYYDARMPQWGRSAEVEISSENLTSPWIRFNNPFLLILFKMENIYDGHVRFLYDQYKVYYMYGFNITYEIGSEPTRDSCSVGNCSLLGNCYANKELTEYKCHCFRGYSGPWCSWGPLCEKNPCLNGGTCSQLSATVFGCQCPPGYNGSNCEIAVQKDCDGGKCLPVPCKQNTPCSCNANPLNQPGQIRYEGRFRLSDKSGWNKTRHLDHTLDKYLLKYMKSIGLSDIDHFFLNISTSGDVAFHYHGSHTDLEAAKDGFHQLVKRGRLENLEISSEFENFFTAPVVNITRLIAPQENPVRLGSHLLMSCIVEGSPFLTVSWWKDGILIDDKIARRSVSLHKLTMNPNEYQYSLVFDKVHLFDRGLYTCQAVGYGQESCASLFVDVITDEPEIRIYPKSATVEKGTNIDILCTPIKNKPMQQFLWIKNKELMPLEPGKEVWEDLYLSLYKGLVNSGSVLEISDIQKSATYGCKVENIEKEVHIEVINRTLVPVCPLIGHYRLSWPQTIPGTDTIIDCPRGFTGEVRRSCRLLLPNEPIWETPDFSDCGRPQIDAIYDNFTRMTLGYRTTTVEESLLKLGDVISVTEFLPGEAKRVLKILEDLQNYRNFTGVFDGDLAIFLKIFDRLLQFDDTFLDDWQVSKMHSLIRREMLVHKMKDSLWNLGLEEVGLEMMLITGIMNHVRFLEYGLKSWVREKVDLFVELGSDSERFVLSSLVYRNISRYLRHHVLRTGDGQEIDYKIVSRLISIDVIKNFQLLNQYPCNISIRFDTVMGNYNPKWTLHCGLTLDYPYWDLNTCKYSRMGNFSFCKCDKTGTIALLAVALPQSVCKNKRRREEINPLTPNVSKTTQNFLKIGQVSRESTHAVVLAGCMCCFLESFLAFTLLLPYWWTHRKALVFLKVQCSFSVTLIMTVFLCSVHNTVPKNINILIATILQVLFLIALSTHLAKVLILLMDVVPVERTPHMKESIVAMMIGLSLLVVLTIFLSQHWRGWIVASWWLEHNSAMLYAFFASVIFLSALYFFLLVNLRQKFLSVIDKENAKAVNKRLGLLYRSGLIFLMLIALVISSTVYVNNPSKTTQYCFSFSSAFLGFILLLCYVLKSESSYQLWLLKRIKKVPKSCDDDFSSEAFIGPLHFFTKEDCIVESENAPPAHLRHIPQNRRMLRKKCRKTDGEVNGKQTEELLKNDSEKFTPALFNEKGALKTFIYEGVDSSHDASPAKYTPMSSFKISETSPPENSVSEYVEHDAKIAENNEFTTTQMITTRVCVELGVITKQQRDNGSSGLKLDTPAIVLCSVDVEPCQSRVLSIEEATAACCGSVGTTGAIVLGLTPEIEENHKSKEEPIELLRVVEEIDDELESNLDEKSDQLEGMLDRISHDLDYLLNRNTEAKTSIMKSTIREEAEE